MQKNASVAYCDGIENAIVLDIPRATNVATIVATSFKNIGVIGRYRGFHIIETVEALLDFLLAKELVVHLEDQTANALNKRYDVSTLPRDELAQQADLIIVVGGDGSLLNAALCALRADVPVLGINRGRLGFLTDIRPDELEAKVGAVLNGHYQEEKRFLLDASFWHENQAIGQDIALNDVVLMPGHMPHMIEFDIHVNDEFVCQQRADGLVVATPTGSTAYALSGGGPILHPKLDAIALVPMFPHNLSSRPIVLAGDDKIEINIKRGLGQSPKVSCDGRDSAEIPSPGKILIHKKPEQLRLIHPLDHYFFETLRSKLGWERK
ncbi:MAG: NAD(+) kinase [Legionellales bacterium]|nr:NAD(+) kinase [Legionellales bacterium]|tara:strand:+ start:12065 stop:13033 length:969 start_codon:yes stop_codon:yes gene_type:complete